MTYLLPEQITAKQEGNTYIHTYIRAYVHLMKTYAHWRDGLKSVGCVRMGWYG